MSLQIQPWAKWHFYGPRRGCGKYFAATILLATFAGTLSAQNQQDPSLPPGTKPFKERGTIEALQGDSLITIKTDKDGTWLVKTAHGQTKVAVEGTADPSYLRPGTSVKFSGTINDKGLLLQPIEKLEVYTPRGKNSIGLFPDGGDDDAKPAKKFAAGKYEIRGKISNVKGNHLTVAIGTKKIVGEMTPAVDINVKFEDLTHAQQGDKVKVSGYYYERDRPNLPFNRPGGATATQIDVTLADPLSNAKKGAKSGKVAAGRGRQSAEVEEPINPREPAGGNAKGANRAEERGDETVRKRPR